MSSGLNRVCAIVNFRNLVPFGRALDYFGWCDVFYSQHTKKATGDPAPESVIDDLQIDFSRYDCLLLNHEVAPDRYAAKIAKQQNRSIVVIGNQHGFYKSILQIKHHPPDNYDYWNSWGKYWIDRYKQIIGTTNSKWVSLGSIIHDYYFRTLQWNAKKTNGKALVVYEPNTDESFGDTKPQLVNDRMKLVFETMEELNIDYDIKAHPLWPNLIGRWGKKMWKPPKKMREFDIENIVDYSIIVGSRSTVLLDGISMGIPVVGITSKSEWEDDEFGPEKDAIFPYATNKKGLKSIIRKHFNKKIGYDLEKLSYYLGNFGKTAERFFEFCKKAKSRTQKSPLKRISKKITRILMR